MADGELYKDKIEVSLDGRQIFYLFFGGAAITGMVFVLGVMVGRRVEARGHLERAQTAAAIDPLAALDRLEGGGLSFQGTLRGGEAPVPEVDRTIGELAKARAIAAKPAAVPAVAPTPAPSPAPVVAVAVADKPERADKPEHADKPEKKPEKTRFTVQLSSFQDKGEAQAFLDQVKASGFSAYVSEGSVDGKQYYRVRLGTYRTLDAANDAKAQFEQSAKKSAIVTKL